LEKRQAAAGERTGGHHGDGEPPRIQHLDRVGGRDLMHVEFHVRKGLRHAG